MRINIVEYAVAERGLKSPTYILRTLEETVLFGVYS